MNTYRECAREGCTESLEGRSAQAVYCNDKCRYAATKAKPHALITDGRQCASEGCVASLNGKRIEARYCSTACLQRAGRARRTETELERVKQYRQTYYENNREDLIATTRQWQIDNPERYRALRHSAGARRRARKYETSIGNVTADSLQARWDYYAGLCWMCRGPATSMDHVKPLAKGGAHIASNLRPACVPCNSSKQHKWYGVPELHRFILHTDPSVSDQAA